MSISRLRPRFLLNISDGQPVNASASNSAWVSKTGDDAKSGKLDLTNPTSGPTVTNVQQTINDINDDLGTLQTTIPALQSDVADLQTLSGVPDDSTDLGTFTGVTIPDNVNNKVAIQALETEVELKENLANKGVADGYASLDSGGKVPVTQLPNSIMEYLGTWNASTNTPSLADGVGNAGDVYIVDVAGTQDLGSGNITFSVSDWIVYNGTIWQKSSNSNSVVSVNGFTGVVVLDLDDVNDVSLTAPASREVLQYDGADWVNVNLDLSANDNATGSNVTLTAVASSIVRLTNASLVSIDMIPAGYSAQKFVLTNATSVPVLISNDIGATAADRILTGTGADLTIANDASVILVYDITSSRWRIVGGSGSGSGSGGINYILNPNAVASTVGWSTYQDAAASTPVDGTGGSPTITLTKDTTSKIIGTNSFKITKDAANRQGEGDAYDFTIDQALAGKNLELSFYYQATANFVYGSIDGVTPSDITCYIYDVTNSALVGVFPNVLDGSGKLVGSFQATQSLSYRLIFHIGTTNALAWDFYYGQVEVGPLENIFIQSDSDWVAYTPTFTGFGTASSVNFRYKKDGPDLLIEGDFISGTATAVEARISLPTGLVASSSLPTLSSHGHYVRNSNGAAAGSKGAPLIREPSVAYFTFAPSEIYSGSSQNWRQKATANGHFTSGDVVSLKASIPIQGWTSGYATPGVSAQKVPVNFKAYKSGGSATGGSAIASWSGVDFNNAGNWNASTGQFTVTYPGIYYIKATLFSSSAADTTGLQIYKNGSLALVNDSNASAVRKSASGFLQLAVGDILTVVNTGTLNITADTTGTTFSVDLWNDPSAFLTIPKSITYTARISSAGVVSDETASFGSKDWITGNAGISGTSVYTLTLNQSVIRQGVSINANVTVLDTGATAAIRYAQLNSVSTTSIAYVTQSQSGATSALTTYGAIITVTVNNE